MRTILIDGDVFVYQIGLAIERPTDWGDDLWTLHSDMDEARRSFASKMQSFKDDLAADEIKIALSCKTEDGFRRQLVPTYKSNRKDTRKPTCHAPLRQHLIEAWGAVSMPRIEADDILGIWATAPGSDERIIVSIDKDFQGVPCDFLKLRPGYNPNERLTITKEQADHWHALQTVMGDKVDGYYGIPGAGPVKAEKILAGANGDYWPVIKKAYEDAELSEAVALENARLAHILRWGEYNEKTNKIKLWQPPAPKK